MLRPRRVRPGAALVEAAFVLPVAIFLILAIVVGGMGVFHYQETCYLAREGARYAAVHGTDYQKDTKNAPATAQDVYDNAIKPQIMTLDPNNLAYSVTWTSSNSPTTVTNDAGKPLGNTVSVTVTYTWIPEWFLAGPIPFTSTSTLPMSY